MKRFVRRAGVVAVIALFFALPALRAHAQNSTSPGEDTRLFITWRAKTYVPSGFRGRVLPTASSRIVASLELIDGGRPVNLTGATIYWYIDDAFIDSGANKQTVEFTAPNRAGTNIDLRVQLPDYKGGVLRTVTIPVVAPLAVIDAPYPNGIFSTTKLELQALPYFFNVPNVGLLNFSWSANGKTPTAEDPWALDVVFDALPPVGSRTSVSLGITNPHAQFFEGGSDAASFVFNQ